MGALIGVVSFFVGFIIALSISITWFSITRFIEKRKVLTPVTRIVKGSKCPPRYRTPVVHLPSIEPDSRIPKGSKSLPNFSSNYDEFSANSAVPNSYSSFCSVFTVTNPNLENQSRKFQDPSNVFQLEESPQNPGIEWKNRETTRAYQLSQLPKRIKPDTTFRFLSQQTSGLSWGTGSHQSSQISPLGLYQFGSSSSPKLICKKDKIKGDSFLRRRRSKRKIDQSCSSTSAELNPEMIEVTIGCHCSDMESRKSSLRASRHFRTGSSDGGSGSSKSGMASFPPQNDTRFNQHSGFRATDYSSTNQGFTRDSSDLEENDVINDVMSSSSSQRSRTLTYL